MREFLCIEGAPVHVGSCWLPHDRSAAIAALWMSCHAGYCCDSQAFHIGRTIDCFSILAVCIAASDPVRDSPWGGDFLVSSSSSLPSPVSDMCVVFKESVVLSCSRRQPRGTATAYIGLFLGRGDGLLDSPIQQLKGVFLSVPLRILQ